MSSPGSVSHWILALKVGDSAAAQPLWERYYKQLIALARKKLNTVHRRAADEEDVVQNAFHSFFQAVGEGRFPQLENRDSLWRLLVVITANKALRQIEHNNRKKRGGGGTSGDQSSIETFSLLPDDEAAILHCIGAEPTPDFAAQVAEEYGRLLDLLGDHSLRKVAIWKMEGYGNDEIAQMLDCSRRTVVRKLEAIRVLWSEEQVS